MNKLRERKLMSGSPHSMGRNGRLTGNSLVFFILLAISGPNHAAAQSTPQAIDPTGPPTSEDPALDLLSRDQYSRRQQATLKMWRDRERSREQVQEAARHPDPEVSGRAKWILRQWRRGAMPDTPPEIARLLQASDGPAAIERLLEGGQFTAALVAVEESAGTLDRESIQTRLASALLRRFPIYAHHAMSSDSLLELLKLVDLVADSKELALCRVELMQHLGMPVTADNLLPSSASLWSPAQRAEAESMLWIVLGQEDRAIEVAQKSVGEDLLLTCRMIAGRWQDAAADSARRARQSEPASFDHARFWCQTLIAADRSEDDALRAEAISELSREVDGANATEMQEELEIASELRWKCLAGHGEVQAALKIASKSEPDAAASVCTDSARVSQAFEVLGCPLDRVDIELDKWIQQAIEAQRGYVEQDLAPETRRMLALMQCLISIGREDAAWSIAKGLCDSDVSIDTLRLREFVLSSLTMTRRADWAVLLAANETDQSLTPQTYSTLARILPDCDMMSLEVVVQAMSGILRNSSVPSRVLAASQLFQGELPQDFDRTRGFRQLYEYVTGPAPYQNLRGTALGRQGMLANLNLVQLFARHGESTLAMQCLNRLVQNRDAKAVLFLAEQELGGGRSEAADELFQTVFEIIQQQARDADRLSGTEDVSLAVKAKIGQWLIARRNGDELTSQELEREIRIALCSPSLRLRSTIAEYLGTLEEEAFAKEVFERVLPVVMFGNDEQTVLYDVARNYAPLVREANPEDAAKWFDLAVIGTNSSLGFRPAAYVTLPLFVRRWSIEAAISAGDEAAVERHLDRILQLDPLDIDIAERLLPKMRTQGMAELADRALDQIMDLGQQHTAQFPFDAMTSNNLAWVAAMNERRLDDALALSQHAVFIEPESAIYRDTLAEVLFLLGRKQEALLIERGCLIDDPSQWHLHEQVEKYTRALDDNAG